MFQNYEKNIEKVKIKMSKFNEEKAIIADLVYDPNCNGEHLQMMIKA